MKRLPWTEDKRTPEERDEAARIVQQAIIDAGAQVDREMARIRHLLRTDPKRLLIWYPNVKSLRDL